MTPSFGALIRQLRLANGLTQAVLAERAGVAERTIQELERRAARPRRDTVRRLIAALNPPPEESSQLESIPPSPRRVVSDSGPLRQQRRRQLSDTVGRHPGNLPMLRSRLIGREQETEAVRQLLLDAEVALVTLTGTGGVGKTRLALQVASEIHDAFSDGVYFVELAPIADPALVMPTIAQALGVRDIGSRPALHAVTDFLREKRLLLLLDNFEQILPAASNVADLLRACPDLKVLVTSRAVLHLRGEHEYPVPPLGLPEPGRRSLAAELASYPALALFAQRAMEARPSFTLDDDNAATAAEICRRLDGLPLAIELAAARVKLLAPQAMLNRLERRLPLLTGGARDLPERQRTLRDTIAWSYDLLDVAEQRLFRRLAVFVGGCTFEAAEAVCDADGDLGLDLFDGVASLVDKSLLRQEDGPDGEPRFTMLETIREYALEQLQAAGEEEPTIRRRHLAWACDLAERGQEGIHGLDGVAWIDRLAAEHDNFRAALTWSLADHDRTSARTGLVMAGALNQFWNFRDHAAEGYRWLEQLLTADTSRDTIAAGEDGASQPVSDRTEMELPPVRTGAYGAHPRVIALNCLCGFANYLDEVDELRAEEALALARQVGDRLGEAHALTFIGSNLRALGKHEPAVPFFAEALAIFESVGEVFGRWRGLHNRGWSLDQVGRSDEARAFLQASLAVARSMGHPWGVGQILLRLGIVAYRQGRLDEATALIEESQHWWMQVKDPVRLHDSSWFLGQFALDRHDWRRAAARFQESLRICRGGSSSRRVAQCLEAVAACAVAVHEPEASRIALQAVSLLGSASALRESITAHAVQDDQRFPNRDLSRTVPGVTAEARAEALESGRAMPLEQAVELALSLAAEIQAAAPEPVSDSG